MEWNYSINKGFNYSGLPKIDLVFGTNRQEIRNILFYDDVINKGRYENEDSYYNLFGLEDHWLRLDFTNGLLSHIEVLKGIVNFDGVSIHSNSALDKTLESLRSKGYSFEETDYSYVNKTIKIDLGDSQKNGGIDNLIYWILVGDSLDYIDVVE